MIVSASTHPMGIGMGTQPGSRIGTAALTRAMPFLGAVTCTQWATLGIHPAGAFGFANGLCANFVSAILKSVGVAVDPNVTSTPAVLERHLQALGWRHVSASLAPPGSAVFFTQPIGHAAIVTSFDGRWVNVINSNNDAVEVPQTVRLDRYNPLEEGANMRIYCPPDTA